MSLLDLYDLSLRGRRDTPALECELPDGSLLSLTFGEVDARSERVATLLRSRGLARGDRLAFCLVNRVAVIDLWLACVKLGVIVVPINVLYKGREIAHIVGDSKPTAVVTTPDRNVDFPMGTTVWDVETLEREAEALRAEAASTAEASVPDGASAVTGAEPVFERCDANTPAALVYTSGTTGVAKGAVLTHGNFAANALALVTAWGITSTDRYLAALPLFHVHGLGNGLQCWLASGCHMRLVERFERDRALAWFEDYAPTLFFGVPTMFVRMLEAEPERAHAIGARMRLFVSGSAPLPAQVHESFLQRFGHVILERYGMTETLMNVSNPLVGERRAGTVGLPLPMTSIEIRDENGAPVGTDAVGELWVQGPNVCAGYWHWPEATAQAFKDGWFRTSDIGTRSADGYITLQGRRSDLIISGGFNIYPREIEEFLLALPGVREAAVTGESDPVRGEVPVAYIVCDDGVEMSALEAAVRAELASFKVPRHWVRVPALPRTALGKVQKHLLPALRS